MRKAVTIAHVSSMAGHHGIGDIQETMDTVAWCAEAGVDLQFLPLTDPSDGACPYTGKSAFARNWRFISLDMLVFDGLLSSADLTDAPAFKEDSVEFELVSQYKWRLLQVAYNNWTEQSADKLHARYEAFVQEAGYWLEDYALFCALKEKYNQAPWWLWSKELAEFAPAAVAKTKAELSDRIRMYMFVQFIFAHQWSALRKLAANVNVRLIGDMPIFVSHDSADVWAHQELFKLDGNHMPTVIAGVPPDYFSKDGQKWGNPHYKWEAMRAEGYRWWIERVRITLELVDVVRIDHFRGFDQAWEVAADAATAKQGKWVDAPGLELFEIVKAEFGGDVIIAEDLGLINRSVRNLRDTLGFPGMRVLQFGFGGASWLSILLLSLSKRFREGWVRGLLLRLALRNINLPHHYVPNSVAYTGTHDNKTVLHWYEGLSHKEKLFVRLYLGDNGEAINWQMIEACLAAVADQAAFPIQDALGLGAEGLMNTPGVAAGNWGWRMKRGALTSELAANIRTLVYRHGRC